MSVSSGSSSSRSSRPRMLPRVASVGLLIEPVPNASDRADVDSARLELGAQAGNIDLDRVLREIGAKAPDRLQQPVFAHHFGRIEQQAFQDGPFATGERDRRAR